MEAICKADYDGRVRRREEVEQKLELAKKSGKPTDGIVVPMVGYFDCYGVWFSGQLIELVRQVGHRRFKTDLGEMMHVYVDTVPKVIACGIHEMNVYGHKCRLYKWLAQGYHRGLVVLADDQAGNARAERFRQSLTWSWIL
jgi:hypothetical protein